MGLGSMPFRARIANRVIDMLKKAAKKVGIEEHKADRFVLRSILFSTDRAEAPRRKSKIEGRKGKLIHGPGRAARKRAKASRAEQRAKRLYRRAQA